MDDQLLFDTVRALETHVAVSASVAARALGTTEFVLQPAIDRLVACGALHVSVLRARAHPGIEFTTRRVWYHTPDREVAARFGLLTMRPRPTRPMPDAQTPALAS
jgi:hypothetical protein